jgi:hypothetical protein
MLAPGHRSANPPVLRIKPIPREDYQTSFEVLPVVDHSELDEDRRTQKLPSALYRPDIARFGLRALHRALSVVGFSWRR